MPDMENSEGRDDKPRSARKGRRIWKRIDTIGRFAIALWAIPTFFIANEFAVRAKAREAASERERVAHEQRMAEADLARNLIPMLLRSPAERDLALRVLSRVAPDYATSLVDALQSAGQPVEKETAIVVRTTSATRKAARAFDEAVAGARARRDHGNHPEAFRAFHAIYDELPEPLKAGVDARRVAAAESAYERGEYEMASQLLEQALAAALGTPPSRLESALAAKAWSQP